LLLIQGDLFLKDNSAQEALRYFQEAMNIDPKSFLALRVARALREMGQYDEALQVLDAPLASQGNRIALLREKALILNRMKQHGEALRVYEKILEIEPSDRFVQKEIMRLRSLSQPGEKVVSELKRVVGLSSKKDNPQLRGLLAQKLKDIGEVREAVAEYQTASNLDPMNPYYLRQEGFCHYRLKDYNQAFRCLSEALRKNPSDFIAKDTLLKICRITGRLEEFLSLLEEISMLHPQYKRLLGTIKKIKKELNLSDGDCNRPEGGPLTD